MTFVKTLLKLSIISGVFFYAGYNLGMKQNNMEARMAGFEHGKMTYIGLKGQTNNHRPSIKTLVVREKPKTLKECVNQLALAMWLAEGGSENTKDVAKVLTPEKVKEKEPTQEEFYVGDCNASCNESGLSAGKITECLGICRTKEYIQYECAYIEDTEELKSCKADAKTAGKDYERSLDTERSAGQPTFYDRIGDAVVEKIKENKDAND